jgi:hypothetical protein
MSKNLFKLLCLTFAASICVSCGGNQSSQASSVASSGSSSTAASSEVSSTSPSSVSSVSSTPISSSTSSSSSVSSDDGKGLTAITYNGKTVTLGEHALYLDYKLKDIQKNAFTFSYLPDLIAAAKDDTTIYVANGVYWVEDRNAVYTDNHLIGLDIKQKNITILGIGKDPTKTIICGNRGHTMGVTGDWNILGLGDGFTSKDITYANYCNIDLVYPDDPSLNVEKRGSAIVQAQLFASEPGADRWFFDNCRLISYLNLSTGCSGRSYYKNCFLQCTDDSIGGTTVFNNCDFDFYGNHPWGGIGGQSLLNCRFHGKLQAASTNDTLVFSKWGCEVNIVDCQADGNIGHYKWSDYDDPNFREYVSNFTQNGTAVSVSPALPECTVNLDAEALKAFKVGEVYNTYNLLRDTDDWDPDGVKDKVGNYGNAVTHVYLDSSADTLESGTTTATLTTQIVSPAGGLTPKYNYSLDTESAKYLTLATGTDGKETVTGINNSTEDVTAHVTVTLEGSNMCDAYYFTVRPARREAPAIKTAPTVSFGAGVVNAAYELVLESGLRDVSLVTWYRSTTKTTDISSAYEVGVSTLDKPYASYALSEGDVGYYLIVSVAPKSQLSDNPGAAQFAVTDRVVAASDVTVSGIEQDFAHMSTNNTYLHAGFWTVNSKVPTDYVMPSQAWTASDPSKAWSYVVGTSGGATGKSGLLTTARGANLLYTGMKTDTTDMKMTTVLAPEKTAGQGFGSATNQYMDIYIKYDTATETGYGMRIQRTTAYGDAVQFSLWKFVNGTGTQLGDGVYSSCFLADCTVVLEVKNNTLTANVSTTAQETDKQLADNLVHTVSLTADVSSIANTYSGFGFQHTGTVSVGNRTMIESVKVSY